MNRFIVVAIILSALVATAIYMLANHRNLLFVIGVVLAVTPLVIIAHSSYIYFTHIRPTAQLTVDINNKIAIKAITPAVQVEIV